MQLHQHYEDGHGFPVPTVLTLSMQKIIAHLADESGCGFYRLMTPVKTLKYFGLADTYQTTAFLPPQWIKDNQPDVCVFQRQTEAQQATEIERYKENDPDLKLIFDIDDLLWAAPYGNPYQKYFKAEQQKALRKGLRAVELVTASTAPLKDQLDAWVGVQSVILPNLVSGQFFVPPKGRGKRKLRVGYAGSATHLEDLRLISYVIKETHTFVDWIFLGYCIPEFTPYISQYFPGVKVQEYLPALNKMNLDVAVAPLVDNEFNRCKSNLKLIEFGAVGVPVICSKVYPYSNSPGFLITPGKRQWKDWLEAIHAYDNDEVLRMDHAVKTQQYAALFQLEKPENIERIRKTWLKNSS